MNKSLASFVFSGETLFNLEDDLGSSSIVLKKKLADSSAAPTLKVLSKKVLVLAESLSTEDQEFLEKVLGSVNILPDLIDLVNHQNISEYDVWSNQNCTHILIFGALLHNLAPSQVLTKYEVTLHANKKILWADALPVISKNLKNEKRILWTALKSIF